MCVCVDLLVYTLPPKPTDVHLENIYTLKLQFSATAPTTTTTTTTTPNKLNYKFTLRYRKVFVYFNVCERDHIQKVFYIV